MIGSLNAIEVITFFVEDLSATKTFYTSVFGSEIVYQDAVSAVMKLDNLMINLLQIERAPKLVEPIAVARLEHGTRLLLTVKVVNVDAVCAELERHGVKLLNGPIDRPWGRRTAAFCDPAGNVWEVAQVLA